MASSTRTVSWPSHETSFVLTFWKGYGPQAILGLVLELGGMSGQGGRHGVRRALVAGIWRAHDPSHPPPTPGSAPLCEDRSLEVPHRLLLMAKFPGWAAHNEQHKEVEHFRSYQGKGGWLYRRKGVLTPAWQFQSSFKQASHSEWQNPCGAPDPGPTHRRVLHCPAHFYLPAHSLPSWAWPQQLLLAPSPIPPFPRAWAAYSRWGRLTHIGQLENNPGQ